MTVRDTVGFAKVSLMREESKSLSQCLTLGSEGENDVPHRPNPANPRQPASVILALRQYPQGGAPSSALASSRHCGLDPESTGRGIPLYRASHAVILDLTQNPQGGEVPLRRASRTVILDLIQNPQGGGIPLYHTGLCDTVSANESMISHEP